MALRRSVLLVACLASLACSKRTGEGGVVGDAAPTTDVGPARTAPRMSLPFGAVRSRDGSFLVAGYSVPEKGIMVFRSDRDGNATWQKTILQGTKWSEDAFTRWFGDDAGGGVLITMSGAKGRSAIRVGADGTVADAVAISGTYCATSTSLVWVDAKRVVRTMALATGALSGLGSIPEGREARLVCTRARPFVVGEGEDDVALYLPRAGHNGAYERVFSDADFRNEELRDTFEFATARDVGMLRVGMSGSIATREMSEGVLSPIRKLKTRLAEDDVAVDVDATEASALLVLTHESDGACGDSAVHMATGVSALRIGRKAEKEETLTLAAPSCDKELGPFWTDVVGDAIVVSWVERSATPSKIDAPITGLVYVAVTPAGAGPMRRIDLRADGVSHAGCGADGCDVVALVREPGATVMSAESVKALHFAP